MSEALVSPSAQILGLRVLQASAELVVGLLMITVPCSMYDLIAPLEGQVMSATAHRRGRGRMVQRTDGILVYLPLAEGSATSDTYDTRTHQNDMV